MKMKNSLGEELTKPTEPSFVSFDSSECSLFSELKGLYGLA
jgi:hypothetical protein